LKRVVLAFAILLVVVLALLLALRGSRFQGSTSEPGASGPIPSAADGAELEPAPVPPGVAVARDAERVPQPEPEASPEPAGPDEVEIRGTLVAIDEHDVEHATEDGWFVLVLRRNSAEPPTGVLVEDGAWQVRVPVGSKLRVGTIELGGRVALLEGGQESLPIPPDRFLELRAHWLRGTLVHLRDVDTNATLNDVTVVDAGRYPRIGLPHPGEVTPNRTVMTGADSPVLLPAGRDPDRVFLLTCPGHTWGRVRHDGSSGGERVLLLGPGVRLRVRDPEWSMAAELDLAGRRLIPVERLPVGTLHVSVEIGGWSDIPLVLGRGDVEIVAEERTHLEIELKPGPPLEEVPIGGEIVLPAAWKIEMFLLCANLLDRNLGEQATNRSIASTSMERDEEQPEIWRWRLEEAQPGRYELQLFPIQHRISLEVGPAGREDIVIEVPPPGEVRVRVVDAATGLEAAVDRVMWSGTRPRWVRSSTMTGAEWNAGARHWEFRAPQGEVIVGADGGGYYGMDEVVQVGPEPVEVTLTVDRDWRIELRLTDGSTPIPWPPGVQVEILADPNGEPGLAWGGDSLVYEILVEEPGTYRLAVPDIPGYEPIPEQEVYVGESGLAELEIELVRTP